MNRRGFVALMDAVIFTAVLMLALSATIGLGLGESADEIAEYLMIATRGLVYNWCTCNGSYDLAAATQKFVHRLLAYYLPAGTARR